MTFQAAGAHGRQAATSESWQQAPVLPDPALTAHIIDLNSTKSISALSALQSLVPRRDAAVLCVAAACTLVARVFICHQPVFLFTPELHGCPRLAILFEIQATHVSYPY